MQMGAGSGGTETMKQMQKILLTSFLMLSLIATACAEEDLDYFFTLDPNKVHASPTFSLAAPSGLTPYQKVAFVGIGGIKDMPGRAASVDGAMSTGFGFEISKEDKIGGLVGLDLGSINPSDGGAFDRGDLSLALGRYFDDYNLGVSIGVKNITLWHASAGRNVPSFYLAATKVAVVSEYVVIMNAGFGNNAFRTIYDTAPRSDRAKRVSGFGSVAFYPVPQLSVVADYTAGIASLGFGAVPVAAWPVSLTWGLYDVTKEIQGHDKISWIASMAYVHTF